MSEKHPDQEYLDFTYSYFGKPEISRTNIKVSVREFGVLKGFPGYSEDVYYAHGTIVFNNVASSVRHIYEYATNERKEFKREYTITDGPFDEVSEELFSFYLGGISDDPNAWIEWNILATSVHIEDI